MSLIAYIEWNPSPYLLDLGVIKIHVYSLCWILAFYIGWQLMSKIFRIEHVKKELLDSLFFYTFVGALLGARLGEFLFYDQSAFIDRPLEVFLPIIYQPGETAFFGLLKDYEFVGFSGLASHGAAIGIIISSYLFSRKYLKRSALWILDRIAVVTPIGAAAVRVGNFYNSEIIGKPTNLPWAVKFVNQSYSYGALVPRHPAQLYEAFFYILLGFFMWFLYMKRPKLRNNLGAYFGIFIFILFFIRFIIEFFKENQGKEDIAQVFNIGLNNGQILSIPFMIIGLYFYTSSKSRIIKN